MSGKHTWLLFEAIRKSKGENIPKRGALLVSNSSMLFVKNRHLDFFLVLMQKYGEQMSVPLRVDIQSLRVSLQRSSGHHYSMVDRGDYHSGYLFAVPEHFPASLLLASDATPIAEIPPKLVVVRSKTKEKKPHPLAEHIVEYNFTHSHVATLTFEFGKVWVTRKAFRRFELRSGQLKRKKKNRDDYELLLDLIAALRRSILVYRRNTVRQLIRYRFKEAKYRIAQVGDGGHWVFVMSPEGLLKTAYIKSYIRRLYYAAPPEAGTSAKKGA